MLTKRTASTLIMVLLTLSMLFSSVFSSKAVSEAPQIQWSRNYPRLLNGTDEPLDDARLVVQTADGGYAIAVLRDDHSVPPHTGGVDIYTGVIVKTDSSGSMQWEKTYDKGGLFESDIGAGSMVQTLDLGFALSTESGLLLKTDLQGNLQWNQTYDDSFSSVAQTWEGGFVASGNSLTKTDALGNVQWIMKGGNYALGRFDSAITTVDGGFAVVGSINYAWLAKFAPEPLAIFVMSPEKNGLYNVSDVSLAFAVDHPTSWMGYCLDGQANVTFAGNTTLTGLSNGNHSLVVYGNDTLGNVGASETIYFTVNAPFPLTLVAVTAVVVVAVGVSLLVYFKKRRHQ